MASLEAYLFTVFVSKAVSVWCWCWEVGKRLAYSRSCLIFRRKVAHVVMFEESAEARSGASRRTIEVKAAHPSGQIVFKTCVEHSVATFILTGCSAEDNCLATPVKHISSSVELHVLVMNWNQRIVTLVMRASPRNLRHSCISFVLRRLRVILGVEENYFLNKSIR